MIYIWHNQEVVTHIFSSLHIPHKYNGSFAFDLDDSDHPFGQIQFGRWCDMEPAEVPKEFRAALLIMSIS